MSGDVTGGGIDREGCWKEVCMGHLPFRAIPDGGVKWSPLHASLQGGPLFPPIAVPPVTGLMHPSRPL